MSISRRSMASVILASVFLGSWPHCHTCAADGPANPRAAAANPAEEIYRINEAHRQDQIARQLDLNYRMIWSAGYGRRYPNPFEPWPRVPGDIWGYPMPRPIEHPIGHETVRTGPDTWTYRPLYAADVAGPDNPAGIAATPQAGRSAPPAKVQLPGPSDRDEPTPPNPRLVPPRRSLGPREF
ncbi:MAG: hypothetical protein HY288_18545 [Planctomycetia bacterium]|nr:hypothetical protein [Planctomycetia bacterium]